MKKSEANENLDVFDTQEGDPLTNPSCLPIDHAQYRYLPSQNPYAARLTELKGLVFLDHETESHPGHWREQVGQAAPSELHVELGCNGGHVILEWAARNPHHTYIGLDWKFKPIFKAAEKSFKRNLKNVLFFRAHAQRLPYMLGEREVDHLCLFFPDPWPKKSQWKHRLITEERLKTFSFLLKRTGTFHIKTDHPGYFEWILQAVEACQKHWEITECSKDLYANHPDPQSLRIPEVTLFERLFIQQGLPIHSLKLRPI